MEQQNIKKISELIEIFGTVYSQLKKAAQEKEVATFNQLKKQLIEVQKQILKEV